MSAPALDSDTCHHAHEVFTRAIDRVREHFDVGNSAKAREEFADIISALADDSERQFLIDLAATFMHWDYSTALARLRAVWKHQPAYRALLTACVPTSDPGLYHPDTPTRIQTVSLDGPAGALRPMPARREPVLHRIPTAATAAAEFAAHSPARANARRTKRRPVDRDEPRVVTTYIPTTYGIDQPSPEPLARHAVTIDHDPDTADTDGPHQTDGHTIDYDNAAKHLVLGWRCVSCFIERATADAPRLGSRRADDGLCSICRDDHRPGVPAPAPLPEHATKHQRLTAQIEAFCAFLVQQYPHAARALLLDQYHRSPHRIRIAITNWVHTHQPFPTLAQEATSTTPPTTVLRPATPPRRGRCHACQQTHFLLDGICRDCRNILNIAA